MLLNTKNVATLGTDVTAFARGILTALPDLLNQGGPSPTRARRLAL
jgi:hypothetical protein